jgi:hypothetical protein
MVPEERVVKHNEANLMRQKQLKDTYSNKKKKTARNNALLKLPRKYAVADILNEYLEFKVQTQFDGIYN